ncbi:hypothetical protein [Luteimonas sp. A501]
MTTKDTPPKVDASEWEAQEQGLRVARGNGHGPADADAVAHCYRLVATAVTTAPRSQPPPGFAAAVAARVGIRDPRFEPILARSLLLILATASIMAAALYADAAWYALRQALATDAMPWLAAAGICIALNWISGQIRRLHALPPMTPRR